jgi:hypothetical protein
MNAQDIAAELALIEMLRFRSACTHCGPRKPDWDYHDGTLTCVRCKVQFNIANADQTPQCETVRKCETCDKTFQPPRADARYCSRACEQAYRRRVLDAVAAGSLPGSPSRKGDRSAIVLPFPQLF